MIRKDFLKAIGLAVATQALPKMGGATMIPSQQTQAVSLKKALGFGMIKEDIPLLDKFKLVKDLGFDGIEFNGPMGEPLADIIKASEQTGIKVPAMVNHHHWAKPLSDPDQAVRDFIVDSVAKTLQQAKELGADTVLVVPGVVNDKVSYETAYKNAQESVKRLIPTAEKTGVKIGLENVWNNFILSPVEAKRFVDEIGHPLVGWYFDIGNVLRYGWPEHWIETLNKRIVKLHVKEFSRDIMMNQGLGKGFNVPLTEGDINWPLVMKKINEINYQGGWMTLEVSAGDRTHLAALSKALDKIISYSKA